MKKHNSLGELKTRQQELVTKIKDYIDLLIGSVVSYKMKCGKKNCKCVQGKRHICFYLSFKKHGKTVNIYLPKNLVEQARLMTKNHKKLKEILTELSEVNLQLLRKSYKSRTTKNNRQ